MFKLFNIFKRKVNYKDFEITPEILKKKPLCYGELFKLLGMEDLIKSICLNEKYYYTNIRANMSTVKALDNKLEHFLLKTKNKYSKFYKEKYLKSMSAFDRLMYAPKIDNTIADNKIRILLPNHPEYKAPMKC